MMESCCDCTCCACACEQSGVFICCRRARLSRSRAAESHANAICTHALWCCCYSSARRAAMGALAFDERRARCDRGQCIRKYAVCSLRMSNGHMHIHLTLVHHTTTTAHTLIQMFFTFCFGSPGGGELIYAVRMRLSAQSCWACCERRPGAFCNCTECFGL